MKIAFFGPSLLRQDEAQAKQVQLLSRWLPATIVTHHDTDDDVLEDSKAQVLLLSSKGIFSPLANKLKLARFFHTQAKDFDRIICPGTVDNSLFSLIAAEKCVPLLTKRITLESLKSQKQFVKRSQQFPLILVQSKTAKQELVDLGVSKEKIYFFYPLVEDFGSQRDAVKRFSLLFASSPRGPPGEAEKRLQAKGVTILLDACKSLDLSLLLLWRKDYYDELVSYVRSLGTKQCDIRVVNKQVDPESFFALSSAIVVPYTSLIQSPEYPLTAIEALSCGIPVISTTVAEIYEIIQQEKCGAVCVPTADGLRDAIFDVQNHLRRYRMNCRAVFENYFLVTPNKITQLKAALADEQELL